MRRLEYKTWTPNNRRAEKPFILFWNSSERVISQRQHIFGHFVAPYGAHTTYKKRNCKLNNDIITFVNIIDWWLISLWFALCPEQLFACADYPAIENVQLCLDLEYWSTGVLISQPCADNIAGWGAGIPPPSEVPLGIPLYIPPKPLGYRYLNVK